MRKSHGSRSGRSLSRLLAVVGIALSCFGSGMAAARDENPGQWYRDGQLELTHALQLKPIEGSVKNIILFIGDGMGVTTVTASRIFDGQSRGESGEENALAFEKLPYVALAKTYETNQQVADSAGTMTAIMTGIKTKAGVIGVNQNVTRGNCHSSFDKGAETLLEKAEKQGRSTGVVTTTRLTHATPAATYAHAADRDWESDADMPEAEREAGCKDIALQLIEFSIGDGLEVAFGGGRTKFLARSATDPVDPNIGGERLDSRDLTQEWVRKRPRSAFVWNTEQLNAIDVSKTDHVLGLFATSHMSYEKERARDADGEPSLVDMTRKAIQLLSKNPKGYFLMVEGGRIDHAHHAGNAFHALDETREFADAVKLAQSMTNDKETLVIVTADHSHTLSMAGYPKRGNPILGTVNSGNAEGSPAKALDELPYTTLGYANGPGALAVRDAKKPDRPRRDLSNVDTAAPDYLQQALVPLGSETHSGEDVPIYAGGPWAHLFQRTVEQNYIFHVMNYALNVPGKTAPAKSKSTKKTRAK